jgi:uncharacterized protein (UPF0303 family)
LDKKAKWDGVMKSREGEENFSTQLLLEEQAGLVLPSLTITEALEIGEIAKDLGVKRKLPIAVELRLGDWIIYHASLPGSTKQN